MYTGVSQRLCFSSGVMVICASGPEVCYFQLCTCRDIFLVLGWLLVHAKRLLQVRVCVFHMWVCFNVLSCKRERGKTREEEKREVRKKRESDRAQHGSPQMVIV